VQPVHCFVTMNILQLGGCLNADYWRWNQTWENSQFDLSYAVKPPSYVQLSIPHNWQMNKVNGFGSLRNITVVLSSFCAAPFIMFEKLFSLSGWFLVLCAESQPHFLIPP
jgi:hypothetical protein